MYPGNAVHLALLTYRTEGHAGCQGFPLVELAPVPSIAFIQERNSTKKETLKPKESGFESYFCLCDFKQNDQPL